VPKPTDIQYVYKKQIGFTLKQKRAFKKLENYGVNISHFIRIAIREKIQRDWKTIKEEKERTKLPF
jgi:hypothetical protein